MRTEFIQGCRAAAAALLFTGIMGCAASVKQSAVAAPVVVSAAEAKPNQAVQETVVVKLSTGYQREIRKGSVLNGEVVGRSQPGGFFYVDRPQGTYKASTSTETEKTLSFVLDAGETKYVRSSPSLGLMVGRIVLELDTPEKAEKELGGLSYTGKPVAPVAQK